MERINLTPEQQTQIADWKAQNAGTYTTDPIVAGTNIVQDDHLEVDGQWPLVVLGGDGTTGIHAFVPAFADPEFWPVPVLNWACVDYVTDRAGPNGETMPIMDEQQLAARAAANPPDATAEERDRRRDVRASLRDALKRIPDEKQRNAAREALRKAGRLGGKDDAP